MLAHLRIARATDHLEEIVRFYCEGLGFEVIDEFRNHDGFDGVMVGHEGAGYHLEFTHERGGSAPPNDEESLFVFYLPDARIFQDAIARLANLGHPTVTSHNPYWDRNGRTYEDPDGYRVVLCHGAWENRPRGSSRIAPDGSS